MTFSARITAASCLLALLAGYGSALGGAGGRVGPVSSRPWPIFPFATDDRSRAGPVASLPWRGSSLGPCGGTTDCTATGRPWWVSRSDNEGSFFESQGWNIGCPDDCAEPVWTVTADALLLWRSPARSRILLYAPAINQPDVVLLDAAEMNFGAQSGPRIGLTRHLVNDCFIEVNYFGIDGQTPSVERNGNPLALFPPGILVASSFSVDYGSELHSAEVNLRHRYFGRLNFLAGFRWVQLSENFSVVGPNPLSSSMPDVRYDSLVDNSMYGFQIGVHDRLFDRGGPLRVDGFLKAGIYANSPNQQTSTLGNLGIGAQVAARGNQTSMLGEMGLTLLYRLGDHLDVRAGYQLMWIDGVALAPDQIPLTDVMSTPATATVGAEGGLFYHGLHVGLQAHW